MENQPLVGVRVTGKLGDSKLIELSGLTRSLRHAGVFWGINDSGNDPEIFGIDSTGKALSRIVVAGATNTDWEAISSGPCEAGACLYIGDLGDNQERRDHVTIWRVAEPSLSEKHSTQAAKLDIRYPGGGRDVESMWVATDTSIWLLTKRPAKAVNGAWRPVLVYRVPRGFWKSPKLVFDAELVDSLPIVPLQRVSETWITDAALKPVDGEGDARLAVRTNGTVYIFAVDNITRRPGALLRTCSLEKLGSDAGEAVTWVSPTAMLFGNEGRFSDLFTGSCG